MPIDMPNSPQSALTAGPDLSYWFEYGRAWTFQMPKLKQWVQSRLEGHVLNMFGGLIRLDGDVVHNDIDPTRAAGPADITLDAYQLGEWHDMPSAFDTVVLDPPYTAYQAVHTYGTKKQQDINHCRDVVEYILKPGGRVISLGYNSTGMSKGRGFYKEAIALVNCGASHNDYILVCERRL